MILARTFTILAVAAAVGLAVRPADAEQQRRGRGDRGGQRATGPSQRGGDRAEPRRMAPPVARPAPPRNARPMPRGPGAIVTLPGVAVHPRGPYPGPVFRSGGWYPYRSYGPRVRYVSPYYTFRPRVSLGVGLWVGFPIPFPAFGYTTPYPYPPTYGYPAPYPYPYPYPYPVPYPAPYATPYPYQSPGYQGQAPAPPSGSVSVAPVTYGGVSFEITPDDAEVWVDGSYAGRANEFGPNAQPLTLMPGFHRVELRAPGYRLLVFDVTVAAGQVIPYRGALQPGP